MHLRSVSTDAWDRAAVFEECITRRPDRQCSHPSTSVASSSRRGRRLLALPGAVLLGFAAQGRSDEAAFGPAYHEYHLTLAPGQRTEAIGPLFYTEQKESTHLWAVPPLFSHTLDSDVDFEEFDFVYPLL